MFAKIWPHLGQLAYRLRQHYVFGGSVARWLVLGLSILPVLPLLGLLPGGWPSALLLSLLPVSSLYFFWLTRRQGYLQFEPTSESHSPPEGISPVAAFEKIGLHASGLVMVGGKNRYVVEQSAYYECFASRERVIAVLIRPSRLLGVAKSKAEANGWWYIFFQPEDLRQLQAGTVRFGSTTRPALKLDYQPAESDKPLHVYLSFSNPAQRAKIQQDLAQDRPSPSLGTSKN